MEERNEQNAVAAEQEQQNGNSVFRRRAMEHISSPEQLNDYIRVASPRMWVAIIALAVFLTGALVWAAFGHIDSTVYGVALVEKGSCILYIAQKDVTYIGSGNAVEIEDRQTSLISLSPEPFTVTESMSEYARSVGDFSIGEWISSASVEPIDLPDGIYPASIVEERVSVLSLLLDA